jgi:hypothetical protein
MASAANMMAAEGWGDAQSIFDVLRQNPNWQTHGDVPDPGFIGGYQAWAVSYYESLAFVDPQVYLDHVDLDEYIWTSSWPQNPRALIDSLLATPTATELPGDTLFEGPDDPVGIAFWWNGGKKAHAITVWQDDAGTLTITDSDDGDDATHPHVGSRTLNWVAGSSTDLMYSDGIPGDQPWRVTVGYVSFLADTPEPGTLAVTGSVLAWLALLTYRRRGK